MIDGGFRVQEDPDDGWVPWVVAGVVLAVVVAIVVVGFVHGWWVWLVAAVSGVAGLVAGWRVCGREVWE